MTITLKTPLEILAELAERARARRLILNLTQEGLANRSSVSLGSIKRFERTGEISLKSLLKLALVLGALNDFDQVFLLLPSMPRSIEELLTKPKQRKKGRLT